MAPYSLDLRSRVLRDCDAGLPSKEVAAEYSVSRSWVDRVKQRKREHGETTPRQQTKFRWRALDEAQEERLGSLITGQPDATLAELQRAVPTTAALSTLWRTIARMGLTVKKRYTPTNSVDPTFAALGRHPSPPGRAGRGCRITPRAVIGTAHTVVAAPSG